MTEHTPDMELVNIGCGQLQWWKERNETQPGHFVGPAFNPTFLKFVQCACNCHADLLEACKSSLQWIAKVSADQPEGDPTGVGTRAMHQYSKVEQAIRKATE